MNKLQLALGLGILAFSGVARAEEAPDATDGYTIIEVPSDGIERYIKPATDADQVPKSIQGIWWMDGNPSGDILLTLAGSAWDAATRTATLPVYGPGSYTFYPSPTFKDSYLDLVRRHSRYEVQFNEDYTFATVVPKEDDLKDGSSGDLSKASDVVFTMYLVSDGHWVRESWFYGIKVADYQLRRVLTADGKRDGAYANYLLVAKPTSMIGYKYK